MSGEVSEASTEPIFLIAELRVRDLDAMRRYLREVRPLMERYGGEILAISAGPAEVIEGGESPALYAVHRWANRGAFDDFWRSPEYEPLRALRHASSKTRIVIFDGMPAPEAGATTDDG